LREAVLVIATATRREEIARVATVNVYFL